MKAIKKIFENEFIKAGALIIAGIVITTAFAMIKPMTNMIKNFFTTPQTIEQVKDRVQDIEERQRRSDSISNANVIVVIMKIDSLYEIQNNTNKVLTAMYIKFGLIGIEWKQLNERFKVVDENYGGHMPSYINTPDSTAKKKETLTMNLR